jgi:hypothetical protein
MTRVRGHRRGNGLFRRGSWVRSHHRRRPRRRSLPLAAIVIAVLVILVLIAVF